MSGQLLQRYAQQYQRIAELESEVLRYKYLVSDIYYKLEEEKKQYNLLYSGQSIWMKFLLANPEVGDRYYKFAENYYGFAQVLKSAQQLNNKTVYAMHGEKLLHEDCQYILAQWFKQSYNAKPQKPASNEANKKVSTDRFKLVLEELRAFEHQVESNVAYQVAQIRKLYTSLSSVEDRFSNDLVGLAENFLKMHQQLRHTAQKPIQPFQNPYLQWYIKQHCAYFCYEIVAQYSQMFKSVITSANYLKKLYEQIGLIQKQYSFNRRTRYNAIVDSISQFQNSVAHSGFAILAEAKCDQVYTIISRLDKIERMLKLFVNAAKLNSEKGIFSKSTKYIATIYSSSPHNYYNSATSFSHLNISSKNKNVEQSTIIVERVDVSTSTVAESQKDDSIQYQTKLQRLKDYSYLKYTKLALVREYYLHYYFKYTVLQQIAYMKTEMNTLINKYIGYIYPRHSNISAYDASCYTVTLSDYLTDDHNLVMSAADRRYLTRDQLGTKIYKYCVSIIDNISQLSSQSNNISRLYYSYYAQNLHETVFRERSPIKIKISLSELSNPAQSTISGNSLSQDNFKERAYLYAYIKRQQYQISDYYNQVEQLRQCAENMALRNRQLEDALEKAYTLAHTSACDSYSIDDMLKSYQLTTTYNLYRLEKIISGNYAQYEQLTEDYRNLYASSVSQNELSYRVIQEKYRYLDDTLIYLNVLKYYRYTLISTLLELRYWVSDFNTEAEYCYVNVVLQINKLKNQISCVSAKVEHIHIPEYTHASSNRGMDYFAYVLCKCSTEYVRNGLRQLEVQDSAVFATMKKFFDNYAFTYDKVNGIFSFLKDYTLDVVQYSKRICEHLSSFQGSKMRVLPQRNYSRLRQSTLIPSVPSPDNTSAFPEYSFVQARYFKTRAQELETEKAALQASLSAKNNESNDLRQYLEGQQTHWTNLMYQIYKRAFGLRDSASALSHAEARVKTVNASISYLESAVQTLTKKYSKMIKQQVDSFVAQVRRETAAFEQATQRDIYRLGELATRVETVHGTLRDVQKMQRQLFKHNLRQISNSTRRRRNDHASESSGSDDQQSSAVKTRKLTDTVDFFGDSLE